MLPFLYVQSVAYTPYSSLRRYGLFSPIRKPGVGYVDSIPSPGYLPIDGVLLPSVPGVFFLSRFLSWVVVYHLGPDVETISYSLKECLRDPR